jgi:hypothetical protein
MVRVIDPNNPNQRLGTQQIIQHLTMSAPSFAYLHAADVDLSFAEKGVLAERGGNAL